MTTIFIRIHDETVVPKGDNLEERSIISCLCQSITKALEFCQLAHQEISSSLKYVTLKVKLCEMNYVKSKKNASLESFSLATKAARC